MKDEGQKDRLNAHFVARGWYTQIEVPVYYKGGPQEESKLITDVDVLAMRPSNDLAWEFVLGDCKTLKGQSPANRVAWIRGIMEHFSAATGIVILKPKNPIEPDHKLFANSLNVLLLSEQEFEVFDRALLYPFDSSQLTSQTSILRDFIALPVRFPKLQTFCSYIYGGAWNESDLLNLLRRVIGEAQVIATELDPNKREHLALALEGIAAFSVALAHCVGLVFKQYLQPGSKEQLDEALKFLIWGGRERYNFVAKLRRELAEAKGLPVSQTGSLSLSAWDRFIQLVRNMLEDPRTSFHLPQAIRQAAINVMQSSVPLDHLGQGDLLLLKYGMLASGYFCRAAGFPQELSRSIEDIFIKRQSELVHATSNRTLQKVETGSTKQEPEQLGLSDSQSSD
jgi:hypothetical protein